DGGIVQVAIEPQKTTPGAPPVFHSVHYTSSNELDNLSRQEFSANPNQRFNRTALPLLVQLRAKSFVKLTKTFDTTLKGNLTPALAINAVNPRRLVIGTDFLYESKDAGTTLKALGGITTVKGGPVLQNSLGANVSAIAYGGFIDKNNDGDVDDPGEANADVLVVGAGNKLFRRTSGDTRPDQVAAYTGGTIRDIALDPFDHRTMFVADALGDVWRVTDGLPTATKI